MNNAKQALAIGINLFLLYSGMVLVPQLGLLMGIGITPWYLPIILFLAGIGSWVFHRNYLNLKHKGQFLLNSLLSLFLAVLCLLFGAAIYDTSFDGNWYHQDAMYLLKDGWKPAYHYLEEWQTSYSHKYLNHFPIASWSAGAFVFSFTGNIECAKGINLLLIIACFGPAFFLFYRLLPGQALGAFVLALLCAANPILLLNLGNTYVDGQVAAMFTLALLFACLQLMDAGWLMGLLALLAAALLANYKFTTAVYAFILVGSGLLYLLTLKVYKWQKLALIGLLWGIFSYGILGFSPYISNILRKGHPLYPLSEGGEKIFDKQLMYPANFLGKSSVHNFFFSLYAKPEYCRNPDSAQLKTLFGPTLLHSYENGFPDMVTTGPLSAEAFTLLLPLFIWGLYQATRKERVGFLWLFFTLVVSIFINPEAWYSRYVPQLWLLFIVMLLFLMRFSGRQLKAKWLWLIGTWLILILCFFNLYLLGRTAVQGAIHHSKEQLAVLELLKGQEEKYEVSHGWTLTFRNRLGAAGIDTSQLVFIPETDSTSTLIPHSLGARYRPKVKP